MVVLCSTSRAEFNTLCVCMVAISVMLVGTVMGPFVFEAFSAFRSGMWNLIRVAWLHDLLLSDPPRNNYVIVLLCVNYLDADMGERL